jgi:hypothetical protein
MKNLIISKSYKRFSASVGNFNTVACQRLLALVASCFIVTGCSMAGMGYDMAPTLLSWQIERYIPLRSDQKALVDRHLVQFQAWHRATQLPRYSRALGEIDEQFRGPADIANVRAVRERLPEFWGPVAERIAEPMAELLLTLDQGQIDAMKKKFVRANEKQRAQFVGNSPREREAARLKRVQERSEFFLGDLTDRQQAELKRLVAALPPSEDSWMAEREARQQRFIALAERVLANKPSREQATRWSAQLLSEMWVSPDAERRAALERSSQAGDQLTFRMLEQANDEQRRFLSDKLRTYIKDLNSWSRPRSAQSARGVASSG